MNVRAGRFRLLDSMRAIAFMSVLTAHTAFFAGFAADGSTLRPFIARLDVGVRIFFLISAFLLYRPFAAARLRGEPPPLARAYAWRRFLRVAPPYWLALIVVGAWLGSSAFASGHALALFGFAHIYSVSTLSVEGLPQAWSLCVEVSFYALLPLYAWAMRRAGGGLRAELLGALGLFCASVAYKLGVFAMGPLTDSSLLPWRFALPEYLDHFAIGIALAALSVSFGERPSELPRTLRVLVQRPWLAWGMAVVLFVVVSKGIGLTGGVHDAVTEARYLVRHYLYAAIATALLVPALFGDPGEGFVRRLLAWRPLAWVGLVSYGAYLYHFAFLEQLSRWGFGSRVDDVTPYIWFPTALAGSLAIAALSWYAFERPILSLKRLVPAREVERGEATVEPAP
jgi:peptidoglycan/LPS O-acetylase OafA/YrhL